jgi:hypothetical protein
MLNNLPKRSGVEKLLPCTECILQRSDRILVHLVGDLSKAIVELSDGSAGRFQPTRSYVLVFATDFFLLGLELPAPPACAFDSLSWLYA